MELRNIFKRHQYRNMRLNGEPVNRVKDRDHVHHKKRRQGAPFNRADDVLNGSTTRKPYRVFNEVLGRFGV